MDLRLRQYKPCDAEIIASWVKDEETLRKWSSDRFGNFPITGEDINYKYLQCNGDCPESDNFYPIIAVDDNGVVGHLIVRYTDFAKRIIRFGFVIVDDSKRGTGCGKEMLSLAIQYAFKIMKVKKITIGVFEKNLPAYHCYKKVGFHETGETEICEVMGEKWKMIEMEQETF